MLITEALWRIVREKLNCTDAELVQRIHDIDLEDGRLDASFVTLPLPEGPLASLELLRDPYVLLVAPDSPFAGRAGAPS